MGGGKRTDFRPRQVSTKGSFVVLRKKNLYRQGTAATLDTGFFLSLIKKR